MSFLRPILRPINAKSVRSLLDTILKQKNTVTKEEMSNETTLYVEKNGHQAKKRIAFSIFSKIQFLFELKDDTMFIAY